MQIGILDDKIQGILNCYGVTWTENTRRQTATRLLHWNTDSRLQKTDYYSANSEALPEALP